MIYSFSDNQIAPFLYVSWQMVITEKRRIFYDTKTIYSGDRSSLFMRELYKKTQNPDRNPIREILEDYKWISETLCIYAKTGYIQISYT